MEVPAMSEEFRERMSKLPTWQTLTAKAKPTANVREVHEQSLNVLDHIALAITTGVGSMYCAVGGGPLTIVQLISQTFLQLVLLSVIMVGQNLQARHSEFRAENDYEVNMKAELEVETIQKN